MALINPGVGGSGSGGATTIADGADVAEGATTDAAVTAGNTGSVSGKLRTISSDISSLKTTLPLPTGAATAAKQDTGNTSLSSIDGKIVTANTGAVVVSSSVLPTGASISAKQPALGTAGTASADVITVQGITSMTPLKVDGSGVTQPVSGTITANAGTNLNTSALALESGGNLATLAGGVTASKYQINTAQISGTAVSMNNGTTDAGTQRVTLSSDSTGQVKLATGANTIGAISNTAFTANIGTTNGLALDATLTGGTQQTKITDGTNVVGVLKNDGTVASTQNAEIVAGTHLAVAFTTTTAQAVASTDAANYRWVSVQITSQGGSSTVTFQVSNDNSNWVSSALILSSSNAGSTVNNTTSTGLYVGPLQARYFRLNVTGIASGTTAGTVEFSTIPSAMHSMGSFASQNGTWTVGSNSATGSAVPANAFFIGASNSGGNLTALRTDTGDSQGGSNVLGSGLYGYNNDTSWSRVRNANAAANTTGTGLLGVGEMRWDGTNWQRVPAALLAPSTTALNTYSVHLTTNTTTTPTSSTAYISSIAISNEVGGTTSTVTIQDKQGTPLKLVNGFATTALTTTPTVVNFQTPVKMVSGIDIITSGAVAATIDVWVNYYQ